MLNKELHFRIFIFTLTLTAVSLPLSRFFLSVSMFLLALNCVLEGNYKTKLRRIINSKELFVFISLYFIHVIWLFNTSDMEWGLHDVRVKLPLLVFPFFVVCSNPIPFQKLKTILLFFVIAVASNTIISTAFLLFSDKALFNIREISIFISHIRFSLMIVIAIGILIYFIFSKEISKTHTEKYFYSILLLWLIFFLFLLRAFTGIFIFVVLIVPSLFWIRKKVNKKFIGKAVVAFTIFLSIYILTNLIYPFYLYYSVKEKNIDDKEVYTENGNLYKHSSNNKKRENGYYTWSYICEKELEKEWNKKSSIKYDENDKKGQPLKYTLIRYLTSKGLRKDSVGISKLTEKDFMLIENGVANHIFGNKFSLYPRIYEFIWEFDRYKMGQNASGHSLTQRFEYVKTGIEIIKNNFWLGVGTGDVPISFDIQYEKMNSALDPSARLRTHNQYLTFFISFGLIGFIITFICYMYPLIKNKNKLFFITLFFLAVIFMSMLNEDTLETHVGVCLFSFFYALLVFGYDGSQTSLTVKGSIDDLKDYWKSLMSKGFL